MIPNLVFLAVGALAHPFVPGVGEQLGRTRAHYVAVLGELRASDTSALDATLRAERRRLLDALDAYVERGDFGRAASDGARVPWFVDAQGRRCAVAELLHATGEDALVERVRRSANHAWVLDLAADREFQRWLARHGLGFDEAARIQTPVIDVSQRGPADTAPSPGPTAPPAPDGPTAAPPEAPAGGSTGKGTSGSSAAIVMVTSDEDGWWLWWEHAKLEFLRPNRPTSAGGPQTGGYAPDLLRDAIERARREEFPRLVELSRAPDATLRSAAATALGACGGEPAVEPLLALLADPSQEVRHRAILALGATGAPAAATRLLQIARTGRVEGAGERVSPYARPLAIVALGLARRAGLTAPVDAAVRALVRETGAGGTDADDLASAAMFHQVLAPAATLGELALELAFDDDLPPAVRCRATEALGTSHEPAVLSKLQTLLSGARLDQRRSAALALGAAREPAVLPALLTAFELESEPLVRGLVLIAVGRTGGAKAHAFLARVLREGRVADRRWAALALGVLTRETGDPETAKLLRTALAHEKHAGARAAYWIAAGLVRDAGAVPLLADELRTANDPRQRMYAATALALIGGETAAAALRARLADERSTVGRVAIAQGLGIVGAPADAAPMRAAVERIAEPALAGVAATALAFHGTLAALAELRGLAAEDAAPRARRAATVEGLGLFLTRSEPFALSLVSRCANYTVLPDWVQAMFQATL